jgi:hypothetical protein
MKSPKYASVRFYLSVDHLLAAAELSKLCFAAESDAMGSAPRSRQLASAAVISAVAFLEAAINELLGDLAEKQRFYFDHLLNTARGSTLSQLWALNLDRSASLDPLTKYDLVFTSLGLTVPPASGPPRQDVYLLIRLRNELVHARPSFVPIADEHMKPVPQAERHRLEKLLKGRFPENARADPTEAYFPFRCLGHGCAEWAVRHSYDFAGLLFSKIGGRSPYSVIATTGFSTR